MDKSKFESYYKNRGFDDSLTCDAIVAVEKIYEILEGIEIPRVGLEPTELETFTKKIMMRLEA